MSQEYLSPDPLDIVQACKDLASRFRKVAADSQHLVVTGPPSTGAFLWMTAAEIKSKDERCTKLFRLLHRQSGPIFPHQRPSDEVHLELTLFGFTGASAELDQLDLLRRLTGQGELQWPRTWPLRFDCMFQAEKQGSHFAVIVNCSISFHDAAKPIPLATYLQFPSFGGIAAEKVATLTPTTLLGLAVTALHNEFRDNLTLYGEIPPFDAIILLTSLLDIVVEHGSEFPLVLNGFPIDKVESHRALNKIMNYQHYEMLLCWTREVSKAITRQKRQLQRHNGSTVFIKELDVKLTAFHVIAKFFPDKAKAIFERSSNHTQQADPIYFPVYPSGSYTAVSRST